jgi:hypothetical protein
MPPKRRGKDINPRNRRFKTAEEKKATQRKKLQQAAGSDQPRLLFVADSPIVEVAPVEPAPCGNIEDASAARDNHGPEENELANENDTAVADEEIVETLRTFECTGIDDSNIGIVEFDDLEDYCEDHGPPNRNGPSTERCLMHRLMLRVMLRIESEQKNAPAINDKWLTIYLCNHGFWLRSEALPFIAQQLSFDLSGVEIYYLPDIRVWMPDLEFGMLHGTPACPTCSRRALKCQHS